MANAVSSTGAQALLRPPLGPTSDPIFLDHVMCNGSESYLTNCTHRGIGIHGCSHFEDAGVACLGECMIMKLTRRNMLRVSCIHNEYIHLHTQDLAVKVRYELLEMAVLSAGN